jgi:outer membrane protein assembly factor BamB
MTRSQTVESIQRRRLRLWPGVAAIVLLFLFRFGLKLVIPGFEGFSLAMMGAFACALVVVLWWLLLSRAAWIERLGAIALLIVALSATAKLSHPSVWPAALVSYALPYTLLAFVIWAVATRRLPDRTRRIAMVATVLVAAGAWTLVRTDGIDGDHVFRFAWRWSKSAEQLLLARGGDASIALPSAATVGEAGALWPGFRGSGRDGVVRGVRIATDWSLSPPAELWRRPIGPGWSSFAVRGDLVYTQEQRGDHEVVACYHATTGRPVWRHHDAARFFEANSGAGPRATPSVDDGRVYALGATGILNALDAGDGAVVWSRNAASDAGTDIPGWGFTSSPLVVGDLVVVDAGKLAAYDLVTGEPRWFGPANAVTYSSPHLATLDGVTQVLLLRAGGATSVSPADGSLLWEHSWPGFTITQPALTGDGDILFGANEHGTRRIAVAQGPGGWTAEERWTSTGLKPYFNDFVVHDGHAFGFDGRILASIDLATGERTWKGGRYGSGQLVLLKDQGLLLVLSEKGELALVEATPDRFTELARVPAIEGKTWNHPVLVDDVLLVRNGREMAAFRLPHASS